MEAQGKLEQIQLDQESPEENMLAREEERLCQEDEKAQEQEEGQQAEQEVGLGGADLLPEGWCWGLLSCVLAHHCCWKLSPHRH